MKSRLGYTQPFLLARTSVPGILNVMTSVALTHPETEPTFRDVANTVTGLVVTVSDLTTSVAEMFDAMKRGFNKIELRIGDVEVEVHQLNQRVGSLEVTVLDMQEDLKGIGKAIDKDAIRIIDHGRRIVRLEKAR